MAHLVRKVVDLLVQPQTINTQMHKKQRTQQEEPLIKKEKRLKRSKGSLKQNGPHSNKPQKFSPNLKTTRTVNPQTRGR